MRALCACVLQGLGLAGAVVDLQALYDDGALPSDAALQLLQSGKGPALPWHGAKARALLDSAGLPTLEFEAIGDHKRKGEILKEAAFKAAALAVAEETEAARAAGGGDSARLLASHRLHGNQKARFEVHNDFRIDELNESRRNATAAGPNHVAGGVNPFNPFTNPFFNPFTPNPYTPLHSGGGRSTNLLFILFVIILAAAACAVLCGGLVDEEEDSSGDESTFRNMLDGDIARHRRDQMAKKLKPEERGRNCCSGCLSCFGLKCSKTVVLFTLGAVLVSFIGGKILWSAGILQPLLAQVLLFAYVVLLIVGFVAVITHELTKKVRKTLEGLYRNLVDVTEVMPPFLKKSKGSPHF